MIRRFRGFCHALADDLRLLWGHQLFLHTRALREDSLSCSIIFIKEIKFSYSTSLRFHNRIYDSLISILSTHALSLDLRSGSVPLFVNVSHTPTHSVRLTALWWFLNIGSLYLPADLDFRPCLFYNSFIVVNYETMVNQFKNLVVGVLSDFGYASRFDQLRQRRHRTGG
jgi:hypothetical protein